VPDILHRVGIKSSTTEDVYSALTTNEGLAAWWTNDTGGDNIPGGVLRFRFPDGGFDMKVVELDPATRVVWQVVDGPEEWVNTTVRWDLRQEGGYTIVMFAHEGWKDPVEFMHHCSTKWGTFLMSLKSLVEFGEGSPAPGDVRIGDWN
jgi:uncharacterized protein YndB with AHSA1/START domain